MTSRCTCASTSTTTLPTPCWRTTARRRTIPSPTADICREPLVARYPHLQRGYLIEFKYLKRDESADEAGVAAAVGEATAQLERYLADERLARQFPGVRFIGLIVVFHGWKTVFCDAVRR